MRMRTLLMRHRWMRCVRGGTDRRVAASWSSGVARSDSSSALYSDSGKLSFASFTPRAQIAALSYACRSITQPNRA